MTADASTKATLPVFYQIVNILLLAYDNFYAIFWRLFPIMI